MPPPGSRSATSPSIPHATTSPSAAHRDHHPKTETARPQLEVGRPGCLETSQRAREGNRTLDLLITSEPLCRLSYPGGVVRVADSTRWHAEPTVEIAAEIGRSSATDVVECPIRVGVASEPLPSRSATLAAWSPLCCQSSRSASGRPLRSFVKSRRTAGRSSSCWLRRERSERCGRSAARSCIGPSSDSRRWSSSRRSACSSSARGRARC